MLNWDDLRVFGTVARCGSMASASAQLAMDPSTVGRRIMRLEAHLKAALLVRHSTGLQLTRAGTELQQVAHRLQAVVDATRHTSASPVSGVMRISLPEGLGTALFVPSILREAKRFPDLTLEFQVNTEASLPARGEIDLAVTIRPLKESGLVIEQIGSFELGLYASRELLNTIGRPKSVEDLQAFDFVSIGNVFGSAEAALEDRLSHCRHGLVSSDLCIHMHLLRAGMGIGILPCILGAENGLQRVLPLEVSIDNPFWLAIDREMAELTRIKTARRWLLSLPDFPPSGPQESAGPPGYLDFPEIL